MNAFQYLENNIYFPIDKIMESNSQYFNNLSYKNCNKHKSNNSPYLKKRIFVPISHKTINILNI